METVVLSNYDSENKPLKAIFAPEQGMNLLSYKRGDLEVIEQSTKREFEERYAGLGPLIGPHFHTHTSYILPSTIDKTLFPHIQIVEETHRPDPFSHGIARYAPWNYVHSGTQIKGELHGNDLWNGIPLSELEGQDFELHFEARLLSSGLFIKYSITSEKPSMIGLHYYYALANNTGHVRAHVKDQYNDQGKIVKPIPKEWLSGKEGLLNYHLNRDTDFGFLPIEEEHEYKVVLETEGYAIHTHFLSPNGKELQFQIYHPKNAPFCCIEPMTAKEPRKPKRNHSILECKIEILSPDHL